MPEKTVVLKFGSSVLRSAGDLHIAVDEIYRHWRIGCRVLAVVSAFEDVTDMLMGEVVDTVGAECPEATAVYLATGETQTAALLLGSLHQYGLPSRLLSPSEIGLRGEGPILDSTPCEVDKAVFERLWQSTPILILPGFFGLDREQRTVLFGRGGSDISAFFLAASLGASCRLLKDKWCVDTNVKQPPRSPEFRGHEAIALHITVVAYNASSQSRSERLGRHLDDVIDLPPLAALANACLFISRSTFA
jgi:aspartokinase